MSDLVLTGYVEEHEAALFDLYRANLDAAERVIDLFAWRRSTAAVGGGIEPCLAFLRGKLVGTLSAVPVTVCTAGGAVAASWQQDSLVDRAARGQGLGKLLVNTAAKPYDLLVANWTSQPMYRLRKAVGFQDVPDATFLLAPLKPWVPGSWKRRAFAAAQWGAKLPARLRWPSPDPGVRPVDGFDERYDALQERRAASGVVCVRKDAAYLQWRYVDVPGRDYQVLELSGASDDVVRGAVVYRFDGTPGARATLVDVVVEPSDTEALRVLCVAALRSLAAAGAGSVRTFASSPTDRAELMGLGFADTGRAPRLTYRPETDDAVERLRDAEWSFWSGDGDGELYM